MSISYPLTFPSTVKLASFALRQMDVVAMSTSPFSRAQQVYQHSGGCWMADVELPLLKQSEVGEYIAFLDSLRGVYGTFVMGDPLFTAPQGTAAGTPKVNGAHAIRSTSIAVKSFTAGTQLKAGDLIQFGSGSTTRLHRNLTSVTFDGSGNGTLDVWPPTRAALANNDAITISSPKGIWRLASNERAYEIVKPNFFKIAFAAIEALP